MLVALLLANLAEAVGLSALLPLLSMVIEQPAGGEGAPPSEGKNEFEKTINDHNLLLLCHFLIHMIADLQGFCGVRHFNVLTSILVKNFNEFFCLLVIDLLFEKVFYDLSFLDFNTIHFGNECK